MLQYDLFCRSISWDFIGNTLGEEWWHKGATVANLIVFLMYISCTGQRKLPLLHAILSPLISDDFDVINLAPYTIIADCVPNVHLMHWPTQVATTPYYHHWCKIMHKRLKDQRLSIKAQWHRRQNGWVRCAGNRRTAALCPLPSAPRSDQKGIVFELLF